MRITDVRQVLFNSIYAVNICSESKRGSVGGIDQSHKLINFRYESIGFCQIGTPNETRVGSQ